MQNTSTMSSFTMQMQQQHIQKHTHTQTVSSQNDWWTIADSLYSRQSLSFASLTIFLLVSFIYRFCWFSTWFSIVLHFFFFIFVDIDELKPRNKYNAPWCDQNTLGTAEKKDTIEKHLNVHREFWSWTHNKTTDGWTDSETN